MLNKKVKPIWLASYPKSGNTWVRIFLSAVLNEKEPDINDIGTDGIISSRSIIDSTLGFSSADLKEDDYLSYRSSLYHKWAEQFKTKEYLLSKVHDACTLKGEVLFPPEITRGVVYIIRNPFDMAASLANHHHITIERAVKNLCSNVHTIAAKKDKLADQISQYLGTWSFHAESWTNVHRNNILVVKYENLLNDGVNEFSKIVDYIGINCTSESIKSAVEATSFKNLQKKEQQESFSEKPKEAERFFRSGKIGGWRQEITMEQANRIIDCNYEALLKYGYIDSKGNILV